MNPVHETPEDKGREPDEGLALCLSGGGYRAMVFHVGVLWRLNEVGLLGKLDRISTVSGGSITAGVLGTRWSELDFVDGVARNFADVFVDPVRRMAGIGIDIKAVVVGAVLPLTSISELLAKTYRKHLFGDATLQDLPDSPRFVFNATNLESGVLMRFSKPYLADYRVGRILKPEIDIAVAVAASSAFPPILSPCIIDLKDQTWVTDEENDLTAPGYRDKIKLSDGGVYDNLGIETAWKRYKTILVSDAGGQIADDPDPGSDWARQTARVLLLIDNQVRSLRKRQVLDSFNAKARSGMYVGIRSDIAHFPKAVLKADPATTHELADLPTRLDAINDAQQERLINWGYVVCDAGLRSHLADTVSNLDATALPYPRRPLD